MTAIVGLAHDGAVHIGADSGASDGWRSNVRSDAKVFRTGPYLIGFTTSFRMGQLLHHAFKPPAPTGNLERFMATTFVDAVRDCLKDGGWAETSHDRESGGQFLVGVAGGRLFEVCGDYSVGEEAAGYNAVGSGYLVALGSLYTTGETRMAPRRRVQVALEAAERFIGDVRGPHTVLTLRAAR